MKASLKARTPALLCTFILLLCSLAAYPFAEIGISDEVSYVKSVDVLAQTGHVVYNGWATAMMGWQLLQGALFVRLFGFSFTAVRASMLPIALATAFLIHRTFVRSGLSSRNATIGTLTVILSPLFLPLSVTFMTDMDGLFVIVLCLYGCLRAIAANSDRASMAWLLFAGASNALGGTARQIAWLGVLVMFPCAVWILRGRRHVVLTGALLYLVSIAVIIGSLSWFKHQPYSVPEPLLPGHFSRSDTNYLVNVCFRTFLSYGIFLLPILIAFVPPLSRRSLRARMQIALCGALSVAVVLVGFRLRVVASILVPVGDYVSLQGGFADIMQLRNPTSTALNLGLRLLVAAAVVFALLSFVLFLAETKENSSSSQTALPWQLSWSKFWILAGPFTFAYILLLVQRAAFRGIYDRYLLPPLVISVVALLRLYQDRAKRDLPLPRLILVALYALYAIAGTHDNFSMHRAEAEAVAELRKAGVPDNAIDGGVEHNGWVQIEQYGYLNNPRIQVPANIQLHNPVPFPTNCEPSAESLTPAIVPGYALSMNSGACGGVTPFAPVKYHSWLGLSTGTLYIVDSQKPAAP